MEQNTGDKTIRYRVQMIHF